MRLLLAFIITVVIYALLIWLYLSSFQKIKLPKNRHTESIVKIDIVNIPPPKKEINKILNDKKLKKENKKRIIKKKIIKRKLKAKNEQKNHISKNKKIKKIIKVKKAKSKEKFIPESEIIYIPNPLIKEVEIDNSVLVEDISPKIDKSYPNPKIKKLYGEEFHSYTPSQKEFIKDNLDEIHRITQETLWQRGYPGGAISAKTGQEGINIVSFYLHPNGDISNLRLKKRVGYRALDDNTIETIKSAYKDYPYPSEKTKIIFFVEYSIFGY